MTIILAAVLMIVAFVGTVAAIVVVPAYFGAIVYDLVKSREIDTAKVADTRLRIASERNVARGFVIAGGAFWSVASFVGLFSSSESGLSSALMGAFIPLVAIAATLIIGWYYERIVAFLLVLASLGVVAWGVIYQFEPGVWAIMGAFLMGPMLTAALLFWLARRDQDALELALSLHPELQPAFADSASQ
ncbi:MAG: hypothetical protein RBS78_08480 [Coriobacteriia bacterium]|jgi:hypothetical protein|nr:hypothetical protein [Coriobacteriia bacterium]